MNATEAIEKGPKPGAKYSHPIKYFHYKQASDNIIVT